MGLLTHTVFAAFVQAGVTAQTPGKIITTFPSCIWPSKPGGMLVSLSQMSVAGPHSGLMDLEASRWMGDTSWRLAEHLGSSAENSWLLVLNHGIDFCMGSHQSCSFMT